MSCLKQYIIVNQRHKHVFKTTRIYGFTREYVFTTTRDYVFGA